MPKQHQLGRKYTDQVKVPLVGSERAEWFGRWPIRSASPMALIGVFIDTRGFPFSARETVTINTLATPRYILQRGAAP